MYKSHPGEFWRNNKLKLYLEIKCFDVLADAVGHGLWLSTLVFLKFVVFFNT